MDCVIIRYTLYGEVIEIVVFGFIGRRVSCVRAYEVYLNDSE
jgi:hypothetical protein